MVAYTEMGAKTADFILKDADNICLLSELYYNYIANVRALHLVDVLGNQVNGDEFQKFLLIIQVNNFSALSATWHAHQQGLRLSHGRRSAGADWFH